MVRMLREHFILISLAGFFASTPAQSATSDAPLVSVVQIAQFPPTSLSVFPGAGDAKALKQAKRDGLKRTDLPSIGSGLALVGSNEFVGITDRGVNFTIEDKAHNERRIFPLPHFAPSIVRFKINDSRIELLAVTPLRDRDGNLLTGMSNGDGEEPCYESPYAKTPLPFDPSGVDPEGVRVLPDGRFLISEEYGPSLLVVNTNGEVLIRYTPANKPLIGARYPVKPILPRVLSQRRDNRGFECLALSKDGRTAYTILQSPAGLADDKRFNDSRVSRAIRLDLSDPLNARVTGHFLMPLDAAAAFAEKQKQINVKLNDADWIGPDKLLVIEQAKGEARLLVADFSKATNLLGRDDENSLSFEIASSDLSRLRVTTAELRTWFSTAGIKAIDTDKLEGLAIVGPDEIALSNDNDFGVGDNKTGHASTVWILKADPPLR